MIIVSIPIVNGIPDYSAGGGIDNYLNTYHLDDSTLIGQYIGAKALPIYSGDYPPKVVRYKTQNITQEEWRNNYGPSLTLADKAESFVDEFATIPLQDGTTIPNPKSLQAFLTGLVKVDDDAAAVGAPGKTYRDLMRTTFKSFYSADGINVNNPITQLGTQVMYMVGVIPSQDEANRILRGIPI